jgi:hypothetical protein
VCRAQRQVRTEHIRIRSLLLRREALSRIDSFQTQAQVHPLPDDPRVERFEPYFSRAPCSTERYCDYAVGVEWSVLR